MIGVSNFIMSNKGNFCNFHFCAIFIHNKPSCIKAYIINQTLFTDKAKSVIQKEKGKKERNTFCPISFSKCFLSPFSFPFLLSFLHLFYLGRELKGGGGGGCLLFCADVARYSWWRGPVELLARDPDDWDLNRKLFIST